MRVPGQAGGEGRRRGPEGSVLILVLWVVFGLVSLTLYFAHSMGMEARAAENRCAAVQAAAAIRGAACYVTNLLANAEEGGVLPDPLTYRCERVPVGEAWFWLIGRSDREGMGDRVVFGIADEGAKLDLNSATVEMLVLLPRMTAELAAAVVDWRDTDSEVTEGGAEDEVYLRLNPAYRCKNGAFESVEELRWVLGMTQEILYGEDTNLNGVLDLNENDGDESPPPDNRDGRLDPGLMEYVTVWTRPASVQLDGTALVDVNEEGRTNLTSLLTEELGTDRANGVLAQLTEGATYASVIEFYGASGLTAEEFALVEGQLTVGGSETNAVGQVNVNTASEVVLAAIPGIGVEKAPSLVARRQSNALYETSMAWVSEVLEAADLEQAGRYLTGRSYQYGVDIGAVGRFGRGWQRVRYVVDTAEGAPKIVARRELTDLGWALGMEVRTNLVSLMENRR